MNTKAFTSINQAFLTLSSANVLVLGANVLALWVMMFYYSKEAIAVYGAFVAVTFFCSLLSTLKLHLAIVREQKQDDRLAFVSASFSLGLYVFVLLLFTSLCFFLLGVDPFFFSTVAFFDPIVFLLFFLVYGLQLGILIYSALVQSERKFSILSLSRVIKALTFLIALFSFVSMDVTGVLISVCVSSLLQLCFLIYHIRLKRIRLLSLSSLRSTIVSQGDLALYTTSNSLLLSLYDNAVIYLFGAMGGSTLLASYTVIDRILRLPASVFGGAATDVFFPLASSSIHKKETLFTQAQTRALALFGSLLIAIWLFIFLLGPMVFPLVFPRSWHEEIPLLIRVSYWLVPFALVGFLRIIPVVFRNQKRITVLDFILHISLFTFLYFSSKNIKDSTDILNNKFLFESFAYGFFALTLIVFAYRNSKKLL